MVNGLGSAIAGSGAYSSAGEKALAEIKTAGGEAVASADSVATPEGAVTIINTAIDNYGRIDILIIIVGNLRDKHFAKFQSEGFDAVVDVYLSGSAYYTLAAWPA